MSLLDPWLIVSKKIWPESAPPTDKSHVRLTELIPTLKTLKDNGVGSARFAQLASY